MVRHKNIPIFIPHRGCPNQCVFCNQKTISGSCGYTLSSVKADIDAALAAGKATDEVEIAFFGGSFTGIDRKEMIDLLSLAHSYLQSGRICGIRLSTRPDYITKEILRILAVYGVTDIELGVQSLDDGVLSACRRGHTAKETEYACRLILDHGSFTLVGQIMLGLPDATSHTEEETVRRLLTLGVRHFRIYPTVVLRNTPLATQLSEGTYTPLSTEDAVKRAAKILRLIQDAGGTCLRIGLCENEELHTDDGILEGPYHPAFGELVMSELFLESCQEALDTIETDGKRITLYIPKGCLSKAIGQKRRNIQRLTEIYHTRQIRFIESDALSGYCVRVQEENSIASQIT